jgi:hypothetical protein
MFTPTKPFRLRLQIIPMPTLQIARCRTIKISQA